jgi:energy-coupling factor transporter ATP-binding protein EcfA2
MSVASQSVANTKGLHVAISGNSGKGKSHACTTMLNLIPESHRMTGTVSNKALYYADDLRPGTVILFDDTSLSDDLQECAEVGHLVLPRTYRTPNCHGRPAAPGLLDPRAVCLVARQGREPRDDQVMTGC